MSMEGEMCALYMLEFVHAIMEQLVCIKDLYSSIKMRSPLPKKNTAIFMKMGLEQVVKMGRKRVCTYRYYF